MLDKPKNVRLFGATPAIKELSRGPFGIRIDFDPAPAADSHAVIVNNAVIPGAFHQGDTVAVGTTNTLAEIIVRALKVGEAPRDSDPFTTVTRAPSPVAAQFVPLELSEFGIVLEWSNATGFPGGPQSTVTLFRDGQEVADSLQLTTRFIDTRYQLGSPHTYILRIVIPAAAVPSNILGGPNESFESTPMTVTGPVRRMTARQTQAFLRRLWHTETTVLRRLWTS